MKPGKPPYRNQAKNGRHGRHALTMLDPSAEMEARRHDPVCRKGASATEPIVCTLGANDYKRSRTTGGSAASREGLLSAAAHTEHDEHRCLRGACTGAMKRRRQSTLAATSFPVLESFHAPRAGSIAQVRSERPPSAGKHGRRGTTRCHGTRLSAAGFWMSADHLAHFGNCVRSL